MTTNKTFTETNLPRDVDSTPIQVLGADDTRVAALTVSGSTGRVALPNLAEIVEVATSGAIHVAFGDSSVTATTSNRYMPAGAMAIYRVLPGQTHIAAIYASGTTSAVLTVGRLA